MKGLFNRFIHFYTNFHNNRGHLEKKDIITGVIMSFAFGTILSCLMLAMSYSGICNMLDGIVDDALYQRAAKTVNSDILIVNISADDIVEYGGIDDISSSIQQAVDILNENEACAPAVIAVDTSEISDIDILGENSGVAVSGSNVVVGNTVKSAAVLVGPNGLFTGEYSVSSLKSSDYINLVRDTDGVVRHYVYSAKNSSGKEVYSFAKTVCEKYSEYNGTAFEQPHLSADNIMYLCYMQPHGKYYSCSLSDIINRNIDFTSMKGKLIFIGINDSTISEGYICAIDRDEPLSNTEVQANVVDSILSGQIKTDGGTFTRSLSLVILSYALTFFAFFSRSSILWLLCFISVFLDVGTCYALWRLGFVVHSFSFMILYAFWLFVAIFVRLMRVSYSYSSKSKMLAHYVDPHIVNEIGENTTAADVLHGETKRIAVLFADIRNYTSLSEYIGADNSVEILNKFLGICADSVSANGGTVDKFIGDCIMAFWGAPEPCENSAYLACKTAAEMTEKIKLFIEEIAEKYNRKLSFGIGINYGDAVVGNIGNTSRMDYTAIGDTVNLASRLEEDAMSGRTYISESVYEQVSSAVVCDKLVSNIRLKGKLKPVAVYSLRKLGKNDAVYASPADKSDAESYIVRFFGTRGRCPVSGSDYTVFGGDTNCIIFKRNNKAIVIDCGTGLYRAKEFLADCNCIDVLVSHLHYDHILGLLDSGVFPAGCRPRFYGTFALWDNGRAFDNLFSDTYWSCRPDYSSRIDVQRDVPYTLSDGTRAVFYASSHGGEASHIVLDFVSGKHICIMTDCSGPNEIPFSNVRDSDLLIYDGYGDPDDKAASFGHSDFRDGCSLASMASVKYLIITHHNSGCNDVKLLEMEKEAKHLFENTSFARDGEEYVI